MIRRSILPVLLVLVAIGCGVGAVLADAGGETAEASDEVTSPVTPVLSARRVPELVTADIADRRLTDSLTVAILDILRLHVPIGTFESLIRLRDDALTTAAAARLLGLHAAWQIDNHQQGAADTASRARVIAGDCVARATIDAVQIFGGYGFVNDYPVEKLMRDARAFEALLGDERLGRVLAQKGAQ